MRILKSPLASIAILTGISFILLFILFQFSSLANKQKNGFNRQVLVSSMQPIHTMQLEVPIEKICGYTSHHAFFSVPNPTWLIMISQDFSRIDTFKFLLPSTNKILGVNDWKVDSPAIRFFANNIPAIFKGYIGEKKMDSIPLAVPAFTRSTSLPGEFAVIRSLTQNLDKQIFQKVDLHNGETAIANDIIPSIGTGGFESDGMFQYDTASHSIFYVEHFSNRFYCMDTNLNKRYMAHTIDTITTNAGDVKRVQFTNEEKIMPVKPRITVNSQFCIGNGFLFILSELRADNESVDHFNKHAVIDLYSTSHGKYTGSIYVPLVNKNKIKSLFIWNDDLIVLYEGQLSRFSLDTPILRQLAKKNQ